MNKTMYKGISVLALLLLVATGCGTTAPVRQNDLPPPAQPPQQETVLYDSSPDTSPMVDKATFTDLTAQYPRAVFKTNKGDIIVAFYAEASPNTVNNFLNLAERGFYNGTTFHRVIEDFMIQGGDPNSKDQDMRMIHGTGGPGYEFSDEFNDKKIVRGSLAMANAGPNTNGSQFFIVTASATPHLDGRHTNFGYVVDGMDVVDAISTVDTDQRDNPIDPIIIEAIELIPAT